MSSLLALISRHSTKTPPKGPWKAKNIMDRVRCWGPVVWDSRVSKNCTKKVWGWNSFQFKTMKQAEGVRDVLNFLEKDDIT